jgi:tetratricopeptide (TPR) repeat protein
MRSLLLLFGCALLAQTPDDSAEGMKALDARQFDTAIEHFTKAIAADPADYGAHFNLGLAYSLSGKDALAIPEYRKTLELKPGILQAEVNLGMSLFNTGQFAEAVEAYGRALAIEVKTATAELGLGRALARLSRLGEAEPHYRNAVALDAANREFLLELASLYEEKGQTREAVAMYREFPENPAAQERMGALLLKAGELPEAVAALEEVVSKSPTAANRVALAEAYVKSGQPAKAEAQAAEALKATPDDFELRFFYGQLLRDQRKFPQAAQQFQAAAQRKPDSTPAWTELAGVLVMAEQLPAALAALDRVRALGGEIAGHFFLRAIVLDRLQQRKEALENYQKFLAASQGKNPDQEFQARQRVLLLERETGKR